MILINYIKNLREVSVRIIKKANQCTSLIGTNKIKIIKEDKASITCIKTQNFESNCDTLSQKAILNQKLKRTE